MLYIQLLTAIIVLIQAVKCGRAPTWINCNCRFLQWTSWSQCTVTCGTGGTRVRTRKNRLTIKKGCSKFTDCATNDEGSQRDSCNRICYNSGAWTSGGCRCTDGWRGRCCGDRVNCGSPGNIVNGHVTGNDFSYGKSVTYICNNLHNMTGGQGVRTCTKDGLWSGTAPQCIYVHTCLSNPCQNGGTCINGLNSYTCQCLPGWSGVNCDRDVQPPMMSGCPSDINITTDKRNKLVNWTEPAFHDPMGTHVSVTKNFPTSQWQFPWGDFKIQIVASKPSNGLSTECVFNVRVRPHTCSDLNIPNFGAKVCNDWKKDLGRYCLVFCDVRHDVYPGIYSNRWFVCGASGEWKPGNRLPDCEASYSRDQRRHEFHFESCTNATDVARLQQTYIDRLKSSHYSYFCSAFSDLCSPANVEVIC